MLERDVHFDGGGAFTDALNVVAAQARTASNLRVVAPLVLERRGSGLVLSLARSGRGRSGAGTLVVTGAPSGVTVPFDDSAYTVEYDDGVVGEIVSDTTAPAYRVLPGVLRWGQGMRVVPARVGTFGIWAEPEEGVRVAILFDEVVATCDPEPVPEPGP